MSKNPSLMWNIAGNETRIILTHACNYKCIFCHNEGFDAKVDTAGKPQENVLLKIIADALALGCKDITLTGGEPLIYKDIVLTAIAFVAAKSPDAGITIVSNASLLTREWIELLKPFNNVRFNISLHTSDRDEYAKITAQTKFDLDTIRENISWLKTAGILFKLNCVAMRETLDPERIKDLINFASSTGAAALKFIELLIMEQQEALFKSYIANTSIAKMLPTDFALTRRMSRRDEYFSPQQQLTVELQKCRCRFGCNSCLTNNTSCFTSKGEFFPCFEYSAKSYDIKKMSMVEALQKGMNVIEGLAEKFGSKSPSLIKDVQFISRRKELYFELQNINAIDLLLNEATLIEKKEYSDYYFTSPVQKNNETVQMRVHHSDKENARLIISTSLLDNIGRYHYTARIFQHHDKFAMVDSPDFIINTMKHLGWTVSHKKKSFEDVYQHPDTTFKILKINSDTILLWIQLEDNIDNTLLEKLSSIKGASNIKENIDDYYKRITIEPPAK